MNGYLNESMIIHGVPHVFDTLNEQTLGLIVLGALFLILRRLSGRVVEKLTGRGDIPRASHVLDVRGSGPELASLALSTTLGLVALFVVLGSNIVVGMAAVLFATLVGQLLAQSLMGKRRA